MSVEEYKAAILEFVACTEQDQDYVELLADLTPGQKAASQWTILSFFMVFSQFEFTEDSADDSEESSELEMYNHSCLLLSSVKSRNSRNSRNSSNESRLDGILIYHPIHHSFEKVQL